MREFPELIGSLYDVAVDTGRFQYLIELADAGVSDDGARLEFERIKSACERHVRQAEELLHRLSDYEAERDRRPIFEILEKGVVASPNPIAQELFGLEVGQKTSQLQVPEHALVQIRAFASGRSDVVPVIRLRRRDTQKWALFSAHQPKGNGRWPLRFVGLDAAWGNHSEKTMQALYGLTPSECAVLGLLASGYSPAEAAEKRERSLETIRQQIRAMIEKTGVSGLGELGHLARAVAHSSAEQDEAAAGKESRRHFSLPDGRILDYRAQGTASGFPVLFLHGCLGGNRFPKSAAAGFTRAGLRVISPARPWHGQSCGLPGLLDDPSAYADDIIRLCEHLGLRDIILAAYDVGAIMALSIAPKLSQRVKAVICVAAQPPMRSFQDFKSAPPQHRLFAGLAQVSVPMLRYLSVVGDRKLKREGRGKFAQTIFAHSPPDLEACRNEDILDAYWTGHHFHVEKGSDGFINDCRLISSKWDRYLKPLTMPVHFIHGADDLAIRPDRVSAFAERLEAQVTFVEEAGHTVLFSNWKVLVEALSKHVHSP